MIEYIILLILLIGLYYLTRYYLKPRAEIKRYKNLLQKLGYKIYEQQFAFMSFSFITDNEKGIRANQDVLHIEKTVYP